MAPARQRKASGRQADYSNIGVSGRKTGITLKDSGIRDEHGLEPLDGIFSSPEKTMSSPRNTIRNDTVVGEADMSIDNSTIPEPIEMLSSRNMAIPPRARSPIKTHLNSSPRKSLGATTSPLSNRTLRAQDTRSKESDANEFADTPCSSPALGRSPSAIRDNTDVSATTKKRKRDQMFDLVPTDTEEDVPDSTSFPLDRTSGSSKRLINRGLTKTADVNPRVTSGNELEQDTPGERVSPSTFKSTQSKRAKARKKGNGRGLDDVDLPGAPILQVKRDLVTMTPIKRRRGRPRKAVPNHITQSKVEYVNTLNKRGEKHQKSDLVQENDATLKMAPSRRKVKNGTYDTGLASASTKVDSSAHERVKPKSRGLLVLRSETPAEDAGAQILRSGRTSVKPLAFWRNERIVYDKSSVDGVRMPLPGMRQVIRIEEETQPNRKRKSRSKKARNGAELEDEELDADPWETEPGFLDIEVMQWDAETQKATEDNLTSIDLAYAPKGLEAITRDVKGSTFQYGKTVTLPFFHSGIVDLPPGGEKKPKNSRKNHMVFWVFTGRVDVEVGNFSFSIGRGGMWQVPRGNLYSLVNPYDNPARVFFAQGCYMTEKEGIEASD